MISSSLPFLRRTLAILVIFDIAAVACSLATILDKFHPVMQICSKLQVALLQGIKKFDMLLHVVLEGSVVDLITREASEGILESAFVRSDDKVLRQSCVS